MLSVTKGIVLRTINYSESSIIVTVYTRLWGLESYMLKGALPSKNKKQKKRNLLQPLSQIEVVVYRKPSYKLQHIKELKPIYLYKNIPINPIKTAVFLFLHEVLYKSLKEEIPNEELFDFIVNSLVDLDIQSENTANFHLFFLLRLSKYLGFSPLNNYSQQTPIFNLLEGCYQNSPPEHTYFIDANFSTVFYHLQNCNNDQPNVTFSYNERKQLLSKLLEYYVLHVTNFSNIQSYKILEEILR